MKINCHNLWKRISVILLCGVLLSGCGGPSEAQFDLMCERRNLLTAWKAQYTNFEYLGGNRTVGYGFVDEAYNDYIQLKGDVVTYWYGRGSDAEITSEDSDYYAVLTCNIEGDWPNEYTLDDIYIRNQTENGFMISSSEMNGKYVSVTFDEITYSTDMGESRMILIYSGYMDDEEVEVRVFMIDSDTLNVYLELPGTSRDVGVFINPPTGSR